MKRKEKSLRNQSSEHHDHKHSAYKFTNKSHSPKSIMSTILGIISIVSIGLTVLLTFMRRGVALRQYGMVLVLCVIFAAIGIGLGIAAKLERDKYYFFAYLGIVLNVLTVIMISMILCAGAYGI